MEKFSALLVICAGNHRWPVNSTHKGQWRGALVVLFFICGWINGWANNRETSDLWRRFNDTSRNWSAVSSNNDLSPFRCQTIISSKIGLLLNRPLATKCWSFSLGLNLSFLVTTNIFCCWTEYAPDLKVQNLTNKYMIHFQLNIYFFYLRAHGCIWCVTIDVTTDTTSAVWLAEPFVNQFLLLFITDATTKRP